MIKQTVVTFNKLVMADEFSVNGVWTKFGDTDIETGSNEGNGELQY
jgi:hypothetical protein